MSVSLTGSNVARKILLIQFLTVIAIGLLFCLKDPRWGASALGGGLAVWLPNVLFMIFAWRHQTSVPAQGRVAWSFALGEVLKVLMTFALLALALAYFKAVFIPLLVTWLSVLAVQLLAPAVINNKG
ncbi:F0F1 ATP synthase subunit I [Salmonella enterica subsp. enterica serovar Choleraesuis]|nr:F0F1 ATP synthase subunit I [Salmonella enterica subsp. enterica serovar Choleraesuis]